MKVHGVGGIFIKSQNPEKMCKWYEKHFDLCTVGNGSFIVPVEKLCPDYLLLSFCTEESFQSKNSSCMLSFQVRDLATTLAEFSSSGIRVEDHIEETPRGRIAWAYDPEGNRLELCQPRQTDYSLINTPEAE